jgi:hypothetical protein
VVVVVVVDDDVDVVVDDDVVVVDDEVVVVVPPPPLVGRNATACMTHAPDGDTGAVAVYDPAVAATRSSAISESGDVITRFVNPEPAAVNAVNVVPAPTTNSFAADVTNAPLDPDVEDPEPECDTSNGATVSKPEYSNTRTSGHTAA